MTEENIIEKVRKLLSLAEGTDSEAEAAAAAAQAQRLMTKHSIAAAMLEVKNDGREKAEDIVNPRSHLGKYASWKGVVLGSVAKANGCGFYKSSRNEYATHHSMHLFGRPSDIDLCRELFEWIVIEIDSLASMNCKGEGRTFSHNYRYGAAESVASAVKKEWDDAEREAVAGETGNALMVIEDALALRRDHALEVQRYGTVKIGLRRGKGSNFNANDEARRAGRRDGQGIYQGKSPTRKING